MNDEIKVSYATLRSSSKQVFLALVAHELTIHGRALSTDLSGDNQITALKGLNEIQHLISGCIAALGSPRDLGQKVDILDALKSKAAIYRLTSHLKQSLTSAWSRFLKISDNNS